MLVKRADIIAELKTDLLRLQGFKCIKSSYTDIGLGSLANAFPDSTFPLGAVHEFLAAKQEDSASTCGFLSGLLSRLMNKNGAALWVSASRTVFPVALSYFGIDPDRFIFIDVAKEKDVLWTMNEALKCSALTAVIGEMKEMSFTESRRLQLSVEESKVTGFVIRKSNDRITTTACVSRWKITSLPSESIDNLPGIGFPNWKVDLLRVRNGKPGTWNIQWRNGKFVTEDDAESLRHPSIIQQKLAG
jgi:protein ImuA